MTEYEVHPFAEAFPMLSPEKMTELVDDIKANGQQLPIIIKDGQIIDGRNRLAACEAAGVEPFFEEYEGESSIENFILSINVNRRHMNRGQQAMAVAIAYPDAEKYKRGGQSLKIKESGINGSYLSQARTVLKHAPELVEKVMRDKSDDPMPLNAAYQAAKQAADAKEKVSEVNKLDELREEAPEVADQVQDGSLSMAAGLAELAERKERKRKQRMATFTAMQKSQMYLDGVVTNPEISLQNMDGSIEEFKEILEMTPDEYKKALSQTAKKVGAFIKQLEKIKWEK